MLNELVVIYLAGWGIASMALMVASKRYSDGHSPAVHPLGVSLIAGAAWPLLVVGLVELGSVVVLAKAQSKPPPGVGNFV